MKTPYYLISEEKLCENVDAFSSALKKIWPNSQLSYSVKTNSLPWLLTYLQEKKVYAEVVSDEEFRLAELCGFNHQEIVFNGPIKTAEKLKEAIYYGAFVNLDSKRDLDTLLSMELSSIQNIGIRINVPPEAFSQEDIGYEEDGFRFGFSDDTPELAAVISRIKEKFKTNAFGLHLHCNSITRNLSVYQSIARYASQIITKYGLNPAYLDMGGGFFGGVAGKPSAEQYIETIHKELEGTIDFCFTKLIVEPGSAIIGSVVDLHTSVLDIKDTGHARIVTTDGSRIHIDPLWIKNRYMYSVNTESTSTYPSQIICGYTCMDHDRLMKLIDEKELQVGDEIVYHRVGAYSMTFGGMFIRYLPDVYVIDQNNSVKQVRTRITEEMYLKINS